MRLAGHHALVTGGGTGIGAAVARALAAEGARLTLVGRRPAPLESAAREIRSSRAKPSDPIEGGRDLQRLDVARQGVPTSLDTNEVCVFPCDVTDRASVDAAFTAAREAHGPITLLVNNAGAATGAPFARVSETLWREMLAVNLDGMFHCCQAALPDLLSAEAGRIVTIASMAGLHGFAYAAPYIAAKHGAVGLTRALAAEFGATRLRVNAVCPGFVESEMTDRSVANIVAKTGRSAEEARADLARLNPSGRLVAPAEVAARVLELILSDRNGEAVEIA
ncbi:MAG: SDR family NAD(P)-dependent oxidoreductase [Alphaproteobacteria bacterium]|nr:SDR family NAD(P)-dependent oxidoreductase [Alphaproteobacteria bacterium]MBV9371734.1 SDR family NAD(P)-dependent oxidoreductase [Alphaproteobacteria bacterium]MBV9902510.1 SDR family NAD(P)-dependent oxidoreductase [Alphaproteobacteria bacterium]